MKCSIFHYQSLGNPITPCNRIPHLPYAFSHTIHSRNFKQEFKKDWANHVPAGTQLFYQGVWCQCIARSLCEICFADVSGFLHLQSYGTYTQSRQTGFWRKIIVPHITIYTVKLFTRVRLLGPASWQNPNLRNFLPIKLSSPLSADAVLLISYPKWCNFAL